jgi:hypothetical protein
MTPGMQQTPQGTKTGFMEFQDQDFKAALTRALRTELILAVVGIPIAWIASGWRSAVLFVVGAAICGTGIMVWQRLMGAVLDRLSEGREVRPLAPVLFWFFTHLLLSGCLLYVSLRGLDGSVYALIAGLGLALIALTIESFRLVKAWTH